MKLLGEAKCHMHAYKRVNLCIGMCVYMCWFSAKIVNPNDLQLHAHTRTQAFILYICT